MVSQQEKYYGVNQGGTGSRAQKRLNSHFDETSDCYAGLLKTGNTRQLAQYRHELHQHLMANLKGLVLVANIWTG
ncbi:hypothetical protein [Thalassomonas sp. RHCl1]|uniref:hypothetical protein n=1 Tax=Thalassomonas sp. RHCl1 TaxID=2995320 RepID=UPI00248C3AF0|nr:hypothetical protein [Thalassomonas sp. RHCl1]